MGKLVVYSPGAVSLLDGETLEPLACLALLGDTISMECYEFGIHRFSQKFCVFGIDSLEDYAALKKELPDKKAIRAAAQMHTRGHTNKDKFRLNTDRLLKEGKLSSEAHRELMYLIQNSTCPPIKLAERLLRMGFGDIVDSLDFYEETPALIESVEMMSKYLDTLGRTNAKAC